MYVQFVVVTCILYADPGCGGPSSPRFAAPGQRYMTADAWKPFNAMLGAGGKTSSVKCFV